MGVALTEKGEEDDDDTFLEDIGPDSAEDVENYKNDINKNINQLKQLTNDYTNDFKKYYYTLIQRKANKAWFRNSGYHASASYANAVNNGQLKEIEPELEIHAYTHPYQFQNFGTGVDMVENSLTQ